MSLPHHPRPTFRTKPMAHRHRPKLIIPQCPLAFIDHKATLAREDPLVAFLEADTAVALGGRCYLRHGDVEFEGAAVAVAMVGLEIRG